MGINSRAISIRASKQYIQAMKVIAAEKGKAVADLVTQALDAAYGDEIEEKLRFFAANDYSDCQIADVIVEGVEP